MGKRLWKAWPGQLAWITKRSMWPNRMMDMTLRTIISDDEIELIYLADGENGRTVII